MSRSDWFRLILLSILWGGSFFFVAIAVTRLPLFSIVWARVTLAACVLAGALLVTRTQFPRGRAIWAALMMMGILNNVVPYSLFVLAQGQISSTLAAILNATTPLWAVIVAHIATDDERLSLGKLAGVGSGFAGVVVMMSGSQATSDIWAIAACLLAALSYALAGVWGRIFRRMGVAPLATAFGQVTASTLILTPVWLWIDRPWTMELPGRGSCGAIVGIAVLSTALAYVIYFRLLASAGATNLLLVTFLIPVSATLLGVLLLDEPLKAVHVAGFGLIVTGLAAIDGRLWKWASPARS